MSAASKSKAERLTDTLPVFFAGRTGTLAIISDDHQVVDNRGTKQKDPGLHLNFGDKGVTAPLDPKRDAEYIRRVREWLNDGDDWRIKAFDIREVRNTADEPAAPFATWDITSAKQIRQMVEIGGYDVRKCVLYEEQNGDRSDVLATLRDLQENGPVKPKADQATTGVKPSL